MERANAVVQKMLGKWQETNKSEDWPKGLGIHIHLFKIIYLFLSEIYYSCIIQIKVQ